MLDKISEWVYTDCADQSNCGFCVLPHRNASFAQLNIMRVERPVSLPACFGQQRFANWALRV